MWACKNASFSGLWLSELLELCGIIFQYRLRAHSDLYVNCLLKIRALEQPSDVKLQKKGIFRQTCVFRLSRVTFHLSLLSIYFWAFERLHVGNLVWIKWLKTNTFWLGFLPKHGGFLTKFDFINYQANGQNGFGVSGVLHILYVLV